MSAAQPTEVWCIGAVFFFLHSWQCTWTYIVIGLLGWHRRSAVSNRQPGHLIFQAWPWHFCKDRWRCSLKWLCLKRQHRSPTAEEKGAIRTELGRERDHWLSPPWLNLLFIYWTLHWGKIIAPTCENLYYRKLSSVRLSPHGGPVLSTVAVRCSSAAAGGEVWLCALLNRNSALCSSFSFQWPRIVGVRTCQLTVGVLEFWPFLCLSVERASIPRQH